MRVLQRVLVTTAGAATVVMLVLANIAFGSTGVRHAVAGKSLLAIKERGSTQMTSDKTFRGHFSLVLNGVIEDSGTTVIRPNEGTTKTVGGQPQTPVFGSDNLTTKKGLSASPFAVSASPSASTPPKTRSTTSTAPGRSPVAAGSTRGGKAVAAGPWSAPPAQTTSVGWIRNALAAGKVRATDLPTPYKLRSVAGFRPRNRPAKRRLSWRRREIEQRKVPAAKRKLQ